MKEVISLGLGLGYLDFTDGNRGNAVTLRGFGSSKKDETVSAFAHFERERERSRESRPLCVATAAALRMKGFTVPQDARATAAVGLAVEERATAAEGFAVEKGATTTEGFVRGFLGTKMAAEEAFVRSGGVKRVRGTWQWFTAREGFRCRRREETESVRREKRGGCFKGHTLTWRHSRRGGGKREGGL